MTWLLKHLRIWRSEDNLAVLYVALSMWQGPCKVRSCRIDTREFTTNRASLSWGKPVCTGFKNSTCKKCHSEGARLSTAILPTQKSNGIQTIIPKVPSSIEPTVSSTGHACNWVSIDCQINSSDGRLPDRTSASTSLLRTALHCWESAYPHHSRNKLLHTEAGSRPVVVRLTWATYLWALLGSLMNKSSTQERLSYVSVGPPDLKYRHWQGNSALFQRFDGTVCAESLLWACDRVDKFI